MAWRVLDQQGRLLITSDGSNCAPVTILNQNDVVIQTVASGGIYNVFVASGIKDGTPLNVPVEGIISDPF